MLSAAVNRNCWMDRGYNRLFPNLYILFIGPSGVGKSSSSGMGMEMLREAELKTNIFKDFITPAALIEFMQSATVSLEIAGKLIHKTPVMIYASELGNLINPRSGVRELTLLLTELFNKQGDHEDTTGKRGRVKIKSPNLTCLLCCFPEWVDEELNSISLRSGFFGRMMVVIEYARRHSNPPVKLMPEDYKLREDLITDLVHIGKLYGEVIWTPSMQEEWDIWYRTLPLDLSDIDDTVEVKGFVSRRGQFVQRLAMLSSIAKRDNLTIDHTDYTFATKLIDNCEKNTRNLKIKPIHVAQMDKLKRNILRLVELMKTDLIPLRNLSQRVYRQFNKKEIEEGLAQLYDIGFCQLEGRKIRVLKSD